MQFNTKSIHNPENIKTIFELILQLCQQLRCHCCYFHRKYVPRVLQTLNCFGILVQNALYVSSARTNHEAYEGSLGMVSLILTSTLHGANW